MEREGKILTARERGRRDGVKVDGKASSTSLPFSFARRLQPQRSFELFLAELSLYLSGRRNNET